jgi:hypothetical protein
MVFTTVQLANQMNVQNLMDWADSHPATQQPFLAGFTNYFNDLQTWITNNGGANPFSCTNIQGLTRVNGIQVVLPGPADRAPFNDAFDDVRTHLNTQEFRLFQAAQAIQRLIAVLHNMNL